MQKSYTQNALLTRLMRSTFLQLLAVILLGSSVYARPDFARSALNKSISVNLKNIALKEASTANNSMLKAAQERSITGKVTSKSDGAALPGVSVMVKGTTKGTVTDMDGRI